MQDEEEALLAIFQKTNDFEIESFSNTFILHFNFPSDYPNAFATILLKCPTIKGFNTTNQISFEKKLMEGINLILHNSPEIVLGVAQVFTIHEIVKELLESEEFMSNYLDLSIEPLNDLQVDGGIAKNIEIQDIDKLATCPEIFTSAEALIEKKSIFIAHTARVESLKEVKIVQTSLLSDKKIQKATHNISAYRIITADGLTIQDFDDDGETHAGQRLLHLLQLSNCTNVIVYVSRYYGGIQLGPQRFKCILNCARELLVKNGFIR